MKNLILMACLLLLACSTPAVDPRIAEFQHWRDSSLLSAKSGNLKWTDYYMEYYSRLQGHPESAYRTLDMQAMSELIPVARQYDAGELSGDQFDDIRRSVGAKYQPQRDRINRMKREEHAASEKEFQEKMKFRPIQSWIK